MVRSPNLQRTARICFADFSMMVAWLGAFNCPFGDLCRLAYVGYRA
jgi:hypothetical protein